PEDRFKRIQEFAAAFHEAVQSSAALNPPIETINTAHLESAIQTANASVSHQMSTPAPHSIPQDSLQNTVSLPRQKRPFDRKFSLTTKKSLLLILLLVTSVVILIGSATYFAVINNSAKQISNARTLIDRANREATQNPVDALQQLSL